VRTLTFVPFLNRIEDLTRPLLHHLWNDETGVDELLMASNSPVSEETLNFAAEAEQISDYIRVVHWPGWSIYEMWNEAIERGIDYDAVIILNNDVTLSEGCIPRLAETLQDPAVGLAAPFFDGRPDPGHNLTVHGTLRTGGWWGAAFAVKTRTLKDHAVPPIDERFRWWGGDDDLAEQLDRARLLQQLVTGTHFVHLGGGSQTGNTLDWVEDAKAADKEVFKQKYRKTW
jgi:hypothetical protein